MCCHDYSVRRSNELLTLAIEGMKKTIACFKTIFSGVLSDFIQIRTYALTKEPKPELTISQL
jgi:hypothetical protein